jgi:hypothetical protein
MKNRSRRFLIADMGIALLWCLAWHILFPDTIARPDIVALCLCAYAGLTALTEYGAEKGKCPSLYSFQAPLLPIPSGAGSAKGDRLDWLCNTRAPFLAAIAVASTCLAVFITTGNEGNVEYPVIRGAYVIASKNTVDNELYTFEKADNQRLLVLNLVAAVKEGIAEKGQKKQAQDRIDSAAREEAAARDAAKRWDFGEFWTAVSRRIRYRGREPINLTDIYLYTYSHALSSVAIDKKPKALERQTVREITEATIRGAADMERGLAYLKAGTRNGNPRSLLFFSREFTDDENLALFLDKDTVASAKESGTPLKECAPKVPPVLVWVGPDGFEEVGDDLALGAEYRSFMNGFFGKKIMIVLSGFYTLPEDRTDIPSRHKEILTDGIDCDVYTIPRKDFGDYRTNFKAIRKRWKTAEGVKFLGTIDNTAEYVKNSIASIKEAGDEAVTTITITERILDETSVFFGLFLPLALGLILESLRFLRFVPWRLR